MAAELCPFDEHIIWTNRCILHSAVAKKRPALDMGPPLFDGQYIYPIALESANDCRIW